MQAAAAHPSLADRFRVAARATGLSKVYGEGETRVVALDSVSVEFGRGRFTAIMGPSGSGKSTLMHCMAGLDSVSAGSARIGDTELTGLKDRQLTRLRRDKVGFVFQSFNLLPTLTALENITLPMAIAGRKPDQQWLDTDRGDRRPLRAARPPPVAALRRPAAAGRRGPRPRVPARRSSSRTSRPATWTPAPAPRSWAFCGIPYASWARPS